MNLSSLAPVVHDVRLDGEGHRLRGRPLQAVHGVRLAVQPWAAIQYTFKCLQINKTLVDESISLLTEIHIFQAY